MEKFKDIKVGDVVYISHKVGGWGGVHPALYGSFFLPVKVTNVTAKFFDTGGSRFYKENGRQRASGYVRLTAYRLGDVDLYGKEVKDQTEEHDEATRIYSKFREAVSLMSRYSLNHKIWSEEDLGTLIDLLTKNKSE